MASPVKASKSRSNSPTKGLSSALSSLQLNNGSGRPAKSRNPSLKDSAKENGGKSPTKKVSKEKKKAPLLMGGGVGRKVFEKKEMEVPTKAKDGSGSEKGCGTPKRKKSKSSLNDRFSSAVEDETGRKSQQALMDYSLTEAEDAEHTGRLASAMGLDLERKILSWESAPPVRQEINLNPSYLASRPKNVSKGSGRRIGLTPERILDAPGMRDDYYLNLLDWSASNILAIGLDDTVYIWNAETGDVETLVCLGDMNSTASAAEENSDYICALSFSEDSSYLSVSTSTGAIMIYDINTFNRLRTLSGHISRVPSLSWSGAILSSGSRTGEIWNSDVRLPQHKIGEMRGHRGEVCGLVWRRENAGSSNSGGLGMLASGGNDNIVSVWDGRNLSTPKMNKTNHTAAVKALAWCPWNHTLLASGGGSSDKTIHFWNVNTGARLQSLPTTSQVTSLIWNPHEREILASHGFPDHQLSIYSYPSLSKIHEITQAHDARILQSAISPDGCTVATASSDENLKFWKVFEAPKVGKGGEVEGRDGKGDVARVKLR